MTDADRLERPHQVRRTPNGGWAWTCHYCGRYACAQSVQGRFVCRCHGGSTPRQRDPEQRCQHKQATGRDLQTPGRPIKHGRYCRLPGIKVADILEQYRRDRIVQQAEWDRQMARIRRDIVRSERQLARLCPTE